MTVTVFVSIVLAFAVGWLCCFLIWQRADRSARLLRDSREIQLTKIAAAAICHALFTLPPASETALAAQYGVPRELIVDLRLAGGMSISDVWRTVNHG